MREEPGRNKLPRLCPEERIDMKGAGKMGTSLSKRSKFKKEDESSSFDIVGRKHQERKGKETRQSNGRNAHRVVG